MVDWSRLGDSRPERQSGMGDEVWRTRLFRLVAARERATAPFMPSGRQRGVTEQLEQVGAAVTRCHSARAASRPRRAKREKPMLCLRLPKRVRPSRNDACRGGVLGGPHGVLHSGPAAKALGGGAQVVAGLLGCGDLF